MKICRSGQARKITPVKMVLTGTLNLVIAITSATPIAIQKPTHFRKLISDVIFAMR
jgi:hypothetical protein